MCYGITPNYQGSMLKSVMNFEGVKGLRTIRRYRLLRNTKNENCAIYSTERGIMQKDRTVSNWDKLPVVLDVHTVALIFDVSDQTVKTWLQTGKLKATKVARKWVIDRDYIRGIVQGGATL